MVTDSYMRYINSKEWYLKRQKWIEKANYECQWCSKDGTALQIHHLTYENLFDENDEDVIVLCRACHKYGDRIRKKLKNSAHSKYLWKYVENEGYPFDMKNKSRHHVRRIDGKLVELETIIEELINLSPTQRAVAKAIAEEV